MPTIKSIDQLKDSRILFEKQPPAFGYILILITGLFLGLAVIWSIHTPKAYTIQAHRKSTIQSAESAIKEAKLQIVSIDAQLSAIASGQDAYTVKANASGILHLVVACQKGE